MAAEGHLPAALTTAGGRMLSFPKTWVAHYSIYHTLPWPLNLKDFSISMDDKLFFFLRKSTFCFKQLLTQ